MIAKVISNSEFSFTGLAGWEREVVIEELPAPATRTA